MPVALYGRGRLAGRLLLAAGVAAPLLYAATVIIGAAQHPGYSHLGNAISELIARGQGGQLEPWFLLYNLLIILFAAGLDMRVGLSGRWFRISAAMIGTSGVLGVAMAWFPQDAVGTPMTPTGIGHLVIAALMSVTSMAAVLADMLAWRALDRRRAVFSARCLAVIFLSGAVAAVEAAQGWPLVGLFERITIGTYLLWIMATALRFLRRRTAFDLNQ